MIVTKNIRFTRVLKLTWETDFWVFASCLAGYLANEYFISKVFVMPALIPTVIGTALAFFIGFSNNNAYARWWEARQIWGSLVNNSRSWARAVLSYGVPEGVSHQEVHRIHKGFVMRQIGFLYALKAALRGQDKAAYKMYLGETEVAEVERHSNVPNAILTLQSRELETMYRGGWIDGFKFMQLNQLIQSFTDDMGKSERIKNTVFPPTYYWFTKQFIWLFSIVITIVASETTGIWSVALGGLVSFIFHTTCVIGIALLNPFEPDVSGIPLDQITRTIEINLLEMLGETEIPAPVLPVKNEYVM